jgi:hypothetical protein
LLTAASVPGEVNVTKSCSKLGITIPQLTESGNAARTVIRLTVANQSGQASFLALAAPWITIPTSICAKLNIAYGQSLSILELKPIQPHTRPPFKTEAENVDMLSLIPPTSTNGYQLYVDEYENNGEQWLRIWYYHPRGAARQIELRRYVNIAKLGQLLGQMQAEGDKKSPRVVFKNVSLSEHADFVSALSELGVPQTNILARCVFNPAKSPREIAVDYSAAYQRATGIGISSIEQTLTMKGSVAADTCVRSSILVSILTSAMDETRKGVIAEAKLRQAFLAKLLSGDGSIDARRTPRRLDVRVKIVDQNLNYLYDYAEILAKEGFIPHVLPEQITVRAYCTWLNLLRLHQIGAFRNNRNWIKLICSIIVQLQGRENQGYERIRELSQLETITSADVSSKYRVGMRSANLWIGTMLRKGLLEELPSFGNRGFKNYAVSHRGKDMCRVLEEIEHDYGKICGELGIDNAEIILQRVKRKSIRTTPVREKALKENIRLE